MLDASAVVDLLLWTPGAAQRIAARVAREEQRLVAPELLDVEVAQVIRRHERRGALSRSRAEELLGDLRRLPVRRVRHHPLLPRAFELRHNLTMYDSVYVALAEAVDAPLLTRDERLARAVPGDRVEVI